MKLGQLVDKVWVIFWENVSNDWEDWDLVPGLFQFTNLEGIFSITKYDNFFIFHYFEGVEWAD